MSDMTSNGMQREANGKFVAHLDRVCVCGRTLGNHLSERPYPQDDTSDGFPDCEGFKKARPKK